MKKFIRYLLITILPVQRIWREKIRGYSWFTKIERDLIIGGLPNNKKDFDYLRKEKVGAILNLCTEHKPNTELMDKYGMELRTLSTPDLDFPSEDIILSGLDFISQNVSKDIVVLVHCAKGRTRSALIMAAYLAIERGHDVESAISYLKSKRPLIKVSSKYIKRLEEVITRRKNN